jgi:hypothetical protein
MHPLARVLRRPLWLVWACMLLGAPGYVGAASSVTADINSGGQRQHAIAARDLGDTHDTRTALTPVTRYRIDDGPADDADTVDPAGPPPLALALTSPARAPALSSVRRSCKVVVSITLGPLGSRPPPFSV